MFFLITGAPGASKTLNAIDLLRKEITRPIFYYGIPDLKLPWILLNDPKNFHNEVTEGSIVVIDEAQQHFPVRSPSKDTPNALKWLETHRHLGIDVYFITQHPNLIDHHARRLVNEHIFLQVNYGMPYAVKYHANKIIESDDYYSLKNAEKTIYRFPKECFDLYKSTVLNTKKARIPKKLYSLPLVIAFTLYAGWYVYDAMSPKSGSTQVKSDEKSLIDQAKAAVLPNQGISNDKKIDWSHAFIPAIHGLPYTAPIYAELAKPTVLPKISACIQSKTKCTCYTQQATKIDMTLEQCVYFAHNKNFDPFQSPEKDRYKEKSRYAENSQSKNPLPIFRPSVPPPPPEFHPST